MISAAQGITINVKSVVPVLLNAKRKNMKRKLINK